MHEKHLNKKFYLERTIHAIIQRLRIPKQKTTKITPFEAHLGRQCYTPISKFTIETNNKNLKYNKII